MRRRGRQAEPELVIKAVRLFEFGFFGIDLQK